MATATNLQRQLLVYLLAAAFAGTAICAEALPDLIPTNLKVTVTNPEPGTCEIAIKWTEVNKGDQEAGPYENRPLARVR
jgi:hypothetical protein